MTEANAGDADLGAVVTRVAADWREHIYYDEAETPQFVAQFWSEHSDFLPAFRTLDLSSCVELACGRGRHAQQILGKFGHLTLMDVNQTNVDHCRARFKSAANIDCVVNNGFNFTPLAGRSVSAIYSYDAMVHFEPEVVLSYIRDAARVLKPGGRALFHHSAYHGQPGSDYSARPHYRNFMHVDLFDHVAIRSGFAIRHQKVVSWGSGDNFAPLIDCISLLEKV